MGTDTYYLIFILNACYLTLIRYLFNTLVLVSDDVIYLIYFDFSTHLDERHLAYLRSITYLCI